MLEGGDRRVGCCPGRTADYLLCVLLIAVTAAVYWQVVGFGFVVADDTVYVKTNQHVLGGLTADSVRWAFSTNYQSNWHPLTWISLMADAGIGKGSPGVFHVTNLVLHVLNTLLLFVLLRWMTGFRWRSAAVAALFALHPLHVESVAWVTERKDVLSTFFWLATMLAYVWYTREPKLRRYLLVVLAFALGLMAKPMLVSLPIVLLLMDFWPLARLQVTGYRLQDAGGSRRHGQPSNTHHPTPITLVIEKTPLFVLSAASCVVTYWAQSVGGSVSRLDVFPLGVRVANALVAYVAYILKMLCPLNLSMGCAHPGARLHSWQVVGSGLFFVAALVIAVSSARRRPYVTFGWLWYLVTLVPVIGLVQVGQQAIADRYTYVPLIGVFVILAWGVPEVLAWLTRAGGERFRLAAVFPVLGVVLLAGLAASTYYQVGYWRDSVSLFEHAVAVDSGSYLTHIGLGCAYGEAKRYQDAIAEYAIALKLRPRVIETHYKLGLTLMQMGRLSEAADEFEYVRGPMRDDIDLNRDLGSVLALLGRVDESIECFQTVLKLSPRDAGAHDSLGASYALKGDLAAAVKEFQAALRLDPGHQSARRNLARAEGLIRASIRRERVTSPASEASNRLMRPKTGN